MFIFLDRYCKEINSKDVGNLLNEMAFTEDVQKTKNPESWQNWMKSVKKVLSEK